MKYLALKPMNCLTSIKNITQNIILIYHKHLKATSLVTTIFECDTQ